MPNRRLIKKPLTPFHPSEKHALARQTAYGGVSAIVIVEDAALKLFVECRMFVQVKPPKQTLGRARRRAPEVKRAPKAQAHAVRLPGRFNHVENNSAVKMEKGKGRNRQRGNGFTEGKTVGQAVMADDQPSAGMPLT